MLMLWQQLRKKWSVKMDKNLYTEIKDNNGNLKGWADKRYLSECRGKHREQTRRGKRPGNIRSLGNGYRKGAERGYKIMYACLNRKKDP